VYRYTGQQSDADSSMYYLRARYYEPSTGRFITRDPKKGELENPNSLNPYVYCENNPIRYTDPSGKNAVFAGIIGGVLFIMQIIVFKHLCTRVRGITNTDIDKVMKGLPEDCPKEKRAEIRSFLERSKLQYQLYCSPWCGLAVSDFVEATALKKENSNFYFNLDQNPGWPPTNFATATTSYRTDKSIPNKQIIIRFYLGTDGALQPVILMP
jgi:RHS repeat-associated protein